MHRAGKVSLSLVIVLSFAASLFAAPKKEYFTEDELDYLRRLRFIKSDFVDYLAVFRFQRKFIRVESDGTNLSIRAGANAHVILLDLP